MSSVLSWDSSTLRAPNLPWAPIGHHRPIKQEPMETLITNSSFMSNQSEGFHSSSPSSSSRDSNPQSPCSDSPTPSRNQQSTNFGPLTPPNCEGSTEMKNQTSQSISNTVTPPKSPSSSPPWVTTSEGALSPADSTPDNDEDHSVRVPAVNSHGKVKTFKCKQCEFVAVTKLDFWAHTKSHIKPERMLNCSKCPFVTEYKHHLEYHMRNHLGSKPFQCSQCSYSCVNKSMLNSHLKSHSNIYQYRCVDCNYATKYCHSLKLHLRKYQHQPAMVLNQDGTPNPLPIIDVYGTRRGPKQKSQMRRQEDTTNSSVAPAHSIFPSPFNFSYTPLIQHSMLFPHNNNLNETQMMSKVLQSPNKEEESHIGSIQPVSPHLLIQPRYMPEYNQTPNSFVSPVPSPFSNVQNTPTREPSVDNEADALDLTNNKQENTPSTPTLKSRRKGKAFKLERAIKTEIEDDVTSEDVMQNLNDNQVEEIEVIVDVPKFTYDSDDNKEKMDVIQEAMEIEPCTQSPSMAANNESIARECFDCTFCDIVFKDIIMYTMHMGYHGYKDPFTCNMCGQKSNDKVSFFVHIARTQHS